MKLRLQINKVWIRSAKPEVLGIITRMNSNQVKGKFYDICFTFDAWSESDILV
jgi:hypothetical protein